MEKLLWFCVTISTALLLYVILSVDTTESVNLFTLWYPQTSYEKIWASEEMNSLVEYAYIISNGDKDFIHTIEAESWRHTNRQSNVYKDWKRETSFWLCQRNTRRRSHIVNDPMFVSWERQLLKCYEQRQQWVSDGVIHRQLYWYNRRNEMSSHFQEVTSYNLIMIDLIYLLIWDDG